MSETENAPNANGSKPHDNCPSCVRLRSALREAKKKLRRVEQENKTLHEELLSAGQMIEDLAADLERPLT